MSSSTHLARAVDTSRTTGGHAAGTRIAPRAGLAAARAGLAAAPQPTSRRAIPTRVWSACAPPALVRALALTRRDNSCAANVERTVAGVALNGASGQLYMVDNDRVQFFSW